MLNSRETYTHKALFDFKCHVHLWSVAYTIHELYTKTSFHTFWTTRKKETKFLVRVCFACCWKWSGNFVLVKISKNRSDLLDWQRCITFFGPPSTSYLYKVSVHCINGKQIYVRTSWYIMLFTPELFPLLVAMIF